MPCSAPAPHPRTLVRHPPALAFVQKPKPIIAEYDQVNIPRVFSHQSFQQLLPERRDAESFYLFIF